MRRIPPALSSALFLVGSGAFLSYGIAPITEIVSGTPAPLPSSLVQMYMLMVAAGVLLYHSISEERWREFSEPLVRLARGGTDLSPPARLGRGVALVALPLYAGWVGYGAGSTRAEPPADPPGIHFNLPTKYTDLHNPLPWSEENIHEGGILYTKYCAVCHGDALDGNGPFARAWQPRPANFRDSGTIAQLDENYLFWRIKEGAAGLPAGTIRYRSVMPAWDGVLTDDEIWKIIMYEYTSSGQQPAKRGE